ncbi:hypothetical protein NLX86_09680 [Streptomyces sp. A3M-1-3]|uniref:hypothetical protein n=1 Tax=Streptomyces sp. A3M-1-3 TaxID=2962044 RepID=UPI0020B6FAA1|nr:hypothetical protein [Streptomyces sp. A3M-1-3]MCP3818376.1 hypothetical protein [Streptomyces sp. A3M-1-3]
MTLLDGSAWEAAALRLLDDVYTFAMTGPRQHEDWADDVLAVMNRTVTDPRGWIGLEWESDRENRAAIRPSYPFLQLTAGAIHEGVHPIEPHGAVTLLASLTQEWTFETSPLRSRQNKEELLEDARILLLRFGADARFWTTSDLARTSTNPDFLQGDLEGGTRFTDHVQELGLIAVSADEVGVFWSFNAG